MVVRASKKCQIVIPAGLRREMGIEPGEYFDIKCSDGRILLTPLGRDPIEELRGILAGGPSLTQELLKERALDLEREERKLARWTR
jgi:AbrB family looped-hinge helix DNA binding protein